METPFEIFQKIFSDKKIISDIYCFVEVDKQDDIYNMLNNIVNQKIFESIYFPRPSTPLGIMLLYNKTKFKVVASYRYLLGKCIKQHFALVSVLQEISFPHNTFAIMVTHLKAWEKNEKIRIKQINKLFNNMENDKNLKNLKINKIILCGDLNTNPDSDCIKLILNNNLQSVFDISEESKDVGNYTLVIDTVDEGIKKLKYDYIFYSNNNIEIINRILPTNFFDFERGLPNENFPSDHLYLFTEFKFIEKNNEIPFDFNEIKFDKNSNIFNKNEKKDDNYTNIYNDNNKNQIKEEKNKDELNNIGKKEEI